MPSADTIRSAVNSYIELLGTGKADDLTALFAEDATVEDPVGSEPRRGKAAIHEFYSVIENLKRETELVSMKVVGNEAAFMFRLTMTAGDVRSRIEPIDHMKFDEDGKVTSMRAFWGPEDMGVVE